MWKGKGVGVDPSMQNTSVRSKLHGAKCKGYVDRGRGRGGIACRVLTADASS